MYRRHTGHAETDAHGLRRIETADGADHGWDMAATDGNLLGSFLKVRRARLDPVACGFLAARRRTPGLRREEVAQRANISAKWYTFLEQGRGGAPSTDVLDRLADALELTGPEREHLFHLAQPRPRTSVDDAGSRIAPALRLFLDAMEFIPAFVKTPIWDIVAWNGAAAAALTDYGALPPERRNLLRLLFAGPEARVGMADWESHARFAVAAFRLETSRSGPNHAATALADELSRSSPSFAAMWRDHEVGPNGRGIKHIRHRIAGPLTFEYATFAVDEQPDLGLVVFTPATPADMERVEALVRRKQAE